MPKGRTLWEMLMDKLKGPVELRYTNPFGARIGSAVNLNQIDYSDYNFFVSEIREYKRLIDGAYYVFTDYTLIARSIGKDEVVVRLRLNPNSDPSKIAGLGHDVLMLGLEDEMAYDEGLHNVLRDATGKFEIIDDGVVSAEFWRVNELREPYHAVVTFISDVDKDSKVRTDEVATQHIEYWDYWRETVDEGGAKHNEFLFVEMNTLNGWFQIWRGREIGPETVVVF